MEHKKEVTKQDFGHWLQMTNQKDGDFFTRLHLELPKEVVEKVIQLSIQLNDELDTNGRWYKEFPSYLSCMWENEFCENKVGNMVKCIVRFHIQKFVEMFQNPEYWVCDEDIKPFIKKEIEKSKTYYPNGEKYSKEGIYIDKETGEEKKDWSNLSSSNYSKIKKFRETNYKGDTK